jgi:hypothetical protein
LSNEIKSDIQHSGETATRQLRNRALNLWHILKGLGKSFNRYIVKYYANPINAIKQDGPNKQLSATPLLTEEEAKLMIVKMHEYGIIGTVKEVDMAIDKDGQEIANDMPYKGKTLHAQEKLAKNELKSALWKERAEHFQKIKFLKNFAEKQVKKYDELSRKTTSNHSLNKRYVFLTNQSNTMVMNDILSEIQTRRIQLKNEGLLPDLNNDGIVDEKDVEVGELFHLSELKKEDLIEGKDFGDVQWNQIPTENSCIQIITKDDFIAKHQDLRIGATYAARVHDENHMKLYYNSQYMTSINDTLQNPQPRIVEFGGKSGDTIAKLSPNDTVKVLQIDNEKDLIEFKNLMGYQDYIINYEDGTCEIQVCESELVEADRIFQKNLNTRNVEKEEKDEISKTLREDVNTPEISHSFEISTEMEDIEIEKD